MASKYRINSTKEEEEDDCPPPPPPPPDEEEQNGEEASMIPYPWERHFDQEQNRYFFYNPVNGDCIWESDVLQEKPDCAQQPTNTLSDSFNLDDIEMELNAAMSESNTSVYTGISHSNLSVIDRSNITLQSKQQKILAVQQAKELALQQSITGQPQLSKKSQSMHRSVEDMIAWNEQRQQRLSAEAQRRQEVEAMQVTGRPQLSQYASTLNSNNNDKQVENRLLEYEHKRQTKLQQQREEQDRLAKEMSHPQVTAFSQKLAADQQSLGNISHVSERLYSLRNSTTFNDNMQALAVGRLTQHDPHTGQRLFEPKLNPISQLLANNQRQRQHVDVEEQLLSMGQKYQQRLYEKQQRLLAEENRVRQLSKVNPHSEKLLRTRSDTSQQRLHRPIGSLKANVAEELQRQKPSFQPQISEGSKAILREQQQFHRLSHNNANYLDNEFDMYSGDFLTHNEEAVEVPVGQQITLQPSYNSNNRGNKTSVYERSMAWAKQKEERTTIERMKAEEQLRKECSFQPFATDHNNNNNHSIKHNKPTNDIADRHAIWLQQKEEKLLLQRQQKAMDEVKDCTFVPKVPLPGHEFNRARSRSRSRSVDRSQVVRSSVSSSTSRSRNPLQLRFQHLNNHHYQAVAGGAVSVSSGLSNNSNSNSHDGSSSLDHSSSAALISPQQGRFSYNYNNNSRPLVSSNNNRPTWLRDPDLYSSDFESLEQLAQMQLHSPLPAPTHPPSNNHSQNSDYHANYGRGTEGAVQMQSMYQLQHQYYQSAQQQSLIQHLQQNRPSQLIEPNDDDDDDLTAPSQAVDLI